MIAEFGKYYMYRHIRLDKYEPFYIGIGTIQPKTPYKRAFAQDLRNRIWYNITNKTDYKVEILLHSDSLDFIRQKEMEFIALYGKKYDKTGILANLSDGGESNSGYKHTPEQREKHRKKMLGKKMNSTHYKEILAKMSPKPVVQLDMNGKFIAEFVSTKEAGRQTGFTTIRANLYKRIKSSMGYKFLYKDQYVNLIKNQFLWTIHLKL